ncbi:hypothetical protein QAD02_023687 [Eretmocerus hayati]|uniref:Uncharacterized protein n=1 Tax=Eretmocerus hayati TaxID=131215 RepID=A0ACC2PWP5_9HYME|nr:hypothetical protein QAD02_023687 [Eretmocerus hayati]
MSSTAATSITPIIISTPQQHLGSFKSLTALSARDSLESLHQQRTRLPCRRSSSRHLRHHRSNALILQPRKSSSKSSGLVTVAASTTLAVDHNGDACKLQQRSSAARKFLMASSARTSRASLQMIQSQLQKSGIGRKKTVNHVGACNVIDEPASNQKRLASTIGRVQTHSLSHKNEADNGPDNGDDAMSQESMFGTDLQDESMLITRNELGACLKISQSLERLRLGGDGGASSSSCIDETESKTVDSKNSELVGGSRNVLFEYGCGDVADCNDDQNQFRNCANDEEASMFVKGIECGRRSVQWKGEVDVIYYAGDARPSKVIRRKNEPLREEAEQQARREEFIRVTLAKNLLSNISACQFREPWLSLMPK